MLIGLLALAALALAYANGANDNFKAAATLYGSGALGYAGARRLATAAQIAGSVASVALAGALIRAFGGKGLVPDAVVGDPAFLLAVGAGAAATVLVATRFGWPISTTHALVGALTGAGLTLAARDLSWAALGGSYFAPLLLSPLLAMSLAAALYPMVRRTLRGLGLEPDLCLCLGPTPQPVDIASNGAIVLRATGLELTLDQTVECQRLYDGEFLGIRAQTVVDRLHEVSACALGFSRGLNDTPKVLALLVASGWAGFDARGALAIVALAMALGGWLSARHVAERLSHEITSLSRGQGLIANSISSALVIGASLLGSPVSTTHVSTGAIFGIGVWNQGTSWRMVGAIASAWLLTLPLAAALAALVAEALRTGGVAR